MSDASKETQSLKKRFADGWYLFLLRQNLAGAMLNSFSWSEGQGEARIKPGSLSRF
jgi:hypothetical protein